MTRDDLPIGCADAARGHHVVPLAQRENLATDQPRRTHPTGEDKDKQDILKTRPQRSDDQYTQQ